MSIRKLRSPYWLANKRAYWKRIGEKKEVGLLDKWCFCISSFRFTINSLVGNTSRRNEISIIIKHDLMNCAMRLKQAPHATSKKWSLKMILWECTAQFPFYCLSKLLLKWIYVYLTYTYRRWFILHHTNILKKRKWQNLVFAKNSTTDFYSNDLKQHANQKQKWKLSNLINNNVKKTKHEERAAGKIKAKKKWS